MHPKFRQIVFSVSCFVAIVLLCDVATACPTCKDGLHDQTATAFAWSIMFMMSMPFFILCGWVFAIVRMRKNMAESPEMGIRNGPELG
ncbi:MAG: hypothetical protein MK108_09550 [Mariniblastus sp.]|nr:hypothetical protein [Mariniblastus sp.]